MPNKPILQTRTRPVVLTGFDLEVDCPHCGKAQLAADDSGNPKHAQAGDEFVALHGFPGRYLLTYRLHCWECGEYFSGRLTIRSRAAPYAGDERRRVWGG